jgi:hypothetical protein
MATGTAFVARNPYDVAMGNFDIAAGALELEQDIRAMIRHPESVLAVNLPVRMDGGH